MACEVKINKNATQIRLLSIFTLISFVAYVTAADNSEATRLLRDVIDPHDNRVRPIINQSKPIDVFVTYHLLKLIDIDEVNQRITVSLWVNFSWWDEIRTWNPEDYGGNNVIHPNLGDVWRPKTVLTNSAGERDVFKDIDSPLSIYSTGASRWYAGGIYYFVCSMDLVYFPFDKQECDANVMSTNLGQEINFIPSTEANIDGYIVNGEWHLMSTEVRPMSIRISKDEHLAYITLSITFERMTSFFLMNILYPMVCLSFLSLFAFVVPKDSGERASFAITVLLALSFFMGTVSSQLPANSDTFPILCIYMFCLLLISMLSVLIIVCQLYIVRSHDANKKTNTNDVNRGIPTDSDKREAENSSLDNGSNIFISNFYFRRSNRVSEENPGYSTQKITQTDVSDKKKYERMKTVHDGVSNPGSHIPNQDDCERDKGLWRLYRIKLILNGAKDLFWKYDDIIFLTIFTSFWITTTALFMIILIQKP